LVGRDGLTVYWFPILGGRDGLTVYWFPILVGRDGPTVYWFPVLVGRNKLTDFENIVLKTYLGTVEKKSMVLICGEVFAGM
jgi:hypothetical protein